MREWEWEWEKMSDSVWLTYFPDNSQENYVGLLKKLDFPLSIISQNKYIAYGNNIIYSYSNCLADLFECCTQIMANSDIIGKILMINKKKKIKWLKLFSYFFLALKRKSSSICDILKKTDNIETLANSFNIAFNLIHCNPVFFLFLSFI